MKIAAFFASFAFSDNCGDFCEFEHNSCVSNAFCNNLDCNSQCYRQFASCLDECINDKTILILKTHSDPVWNHSFNWGGQATEVDFTFGSGSQVTYSCSLTFKDELFVFGGLNNYHQISRVDGCSLEQTEDLLPFRFDNGICTADFSQVYLCFDYDVKFTCRTWGGQGTEFNQLPDSEDDHYIGGVDIVGGELVSFGGKGVASTEIYDGDSRSWSFLDNIDDEISYLFYTSSVVIDGGAEMIVFGGYTNEGFTYPKSTDLTWRLRVDSSGQYIWRRGERLLQPRDSHTAIRSGNDIFLIGGMNDKVISREYHLPFERISFEKIGNEWQTVKNLTEETYGTMVWYPALFSVEPDFCQY